MEYGGGESMDGKCSIIIPPLCYIDTSRIGIEFNDEVALGSSLTIFGQSIGAASDSTGFDDSDGVLGLVGLYA